MARLALALGIAAATLGGCATARRGSASLAPFHSDGCSLYPDGRPEQPGLWCDCCLRHDVAYWRGGTSAQRLAADEELRRCVLERTGNPVLAAVVYAGVRMGGSSAFPTWYRWGYGWPYGRRDEPLTAGEEAAAAAELEAYRARNPELRCDDRGEPISRKRPASAFSVTVSDPLRGSVDRPRELLGHGSGTIHAPVDGAADAGR